MIRHFYHVYAAGAWEGPVAEHAAALAQAGFGHPVTIGLIGPAPARHQARDKITALFAENGLPAPDSWAGAERGWEQATLALIREYARERPDSEAICYAHTKGAWNDSRLNPYWRRSMTRHVIGGWRHCLDLLAGGYDTAGCHWLTPERHHHPPYFIVRSPFYGGNFWWASAAYLRQLPPPGTSSRFEAEGWIGLGSPKAADLLPGWPTILLCMTPYERELWRRRVTGFRGPAAEMACAYADPTCQGPMRWTSVSGGHLDDLAGDSVPLCHSHSLRHDMELGL